MTQTGFALVTQARPEETMAMHCAEFEKWGSNLQMAGMQMD